MHRIKCIIIIIICLSFLLASEHKAAFKGCGLNSFRVFAQCRYLTIFFKCERDVKVKKVNLPYNRPRRPKRSRCIILLFFQPRG